MIGIIQITIVKMVIVKIMVMILAITITKNDNSRYNDDDMILKIATKN